MARTVGIGKQDFEKAWKEHVFYVDKTQFIQEWWENSFLSNTPVVKTYFGSLPYGIMKNTKNFREPIH